MTIESDFELEMNEAEVEVILREFRVQEPRQLAYRYPTTRAPSIYMEKRYGNSDWRSARAA